ncbi:PAS domain-containing protein [Hymenobacter sp.]|uniref:PAS domain-containing protein n=1 Tax=Hymenobacter sp. TaxID=1898978 RepID=UPI002869F05F|nr:PAS domain-containing protein [Hymenobacter sp.]
MPTSALPAPDFALLFAALPAPLAALAPDGRLLALNQAMADLLRLAGPAAAPPGQPLAALRTALAAQGETLAPPDAWIAGLRAARAGSAQVLTPVPAPADAPDAPARRHWEATLQPVPASARARKPRYLLLSLLEVREPPRMQRILDQLPLSITTVEGPDLTFTFLSARARELMGPRAAVGRSVAESLPEVAAQGYTQLLQAVRDSGRPLHGHEERTELLDPATNETRERYHNFGYLPLRGEQGAGVLAYSLDVTEQVLARRATETLQAEVQAADLRLRRQAEMLPIITFTTDAAGRTTYMSPQWYAFTGQPPGGPWAEVDVAWAEHLHPDDHGSAEREIAQSIAQAQRGRVEVRLRGANGQYRWFLTEAVPELDAAGRLLRRYGFMLDVHELRDTQRRLEAKDRQLSQILDQTPAFIATMEGPDHRYTFFNPRYHDLLGRRAQLGQPLVESLPEGVERGFVDLLDHVYRVYRSGKTHVAPEVLIHFPDAATGQTHDHYFDFTYLALRDKAGQVNGILNFAVDVTQRVGARRQAEELAAEISRRDEQVRAITAAVPVFICNFTPGGTITYVNPYFYEYTGLDPATPPGTALGTIPPDDRAAVSVIARAAMVAGQPWQAPFRCRRRDGALRWFQTKAQPYLDAAGQLAGFSSATVEIHELHERTEELTRSRTDFAALADNIAQLAWMADATGSIFWYNQQWYEYTGTTFAEMQGFGWQAVHDPALVEGVLQRFLTSVAAGEPWEDTFPIRGRDGQFRWFLSRARPVRDAATGAVVRWCGTNTDVTELRRLQDQLGDSEEELRIQAESIPQQVWTAQPDGTVDFFNHRTAAYVGESMEKNGAAHWLNFVHPADHAPMQARWQAAIATQRYYEAEFRLRRYDGEYRWFLGQAQARRAPGGQVLKWYGTNTDVHQLRLLQEQVLSSQARFQQLLETLPQMTWTARPDGKATYYSQRWYDYTGATLGEEQEWDWDRFTHPDDLAATLRRWQHSLATGEPFEDETRWRDHRGNYRWFLVRAEAIRDEAGAVVLWVGTHTDVDEFKQVQQQLEAQNARLVRTNEDLDNFVYTASHDLKQPINNMAGIFEELTRTAYFRDPDAIKLITYFERALAQIFATIDDLGAIVQGQRQQQEVPAEEVALAPLVATVISSLQDQVTQLGATFELDFATCPAVTFVRANLHSALFNLISNSLKYAAPGRPPRIRLSSGPDAATGRPVLTVQDNGIGIDLARFGPQLFQLFRRFHTHVGGTGMGLYLVNRIVQNHGGRLEVASTVDEGTTFRIYL